MPIQIIRPAQYKVMPWKNGGGTTTEIAAWPPGAGVDDFDWRVSMAHVGQDGPFSSFPGVDRVLTVLSGEGMDLVVGGETTRLTAKSDPFAFAGDVPTGARLVDGPIDDFNVMVRRGKVACRVERLLVAPEVTVGFVPKTLLYCMAGTVAVGDEGRELAAGETLLWSGKSERVALRAAGTARLLRVELRSL